MRKDIAKWEEEGKIFKVVEVKEEN